MVVCEYSITSAYLQLYLQTNINITSYSSATPFTPGPGDGASTATVSQKTPIYVVPVRRRQSLSIISVTPPLFGHSRGIALRALSYRGLHPTPPLTWKSLVNEYSMWHCRIQRPDRFRNRLNLRPIVICVKYSDKLSPVNRPEHTGWSLNIDVGFLPNNCVFACSHFFTDWFEFSWIDPEVRGPRKEPAPHGFNVAKGSTHMAVTREFVEFAVNDLRAEDLLYWMRDIKVPDEHFFPTLSHNPLMDIPGAYLGQF